MAKKGKTNQSEKKVKAQPQKSKAVKSSTTTSEKRIIKGHRNFLRGLEKRREELIIANRATNNKHEQELEAIEKQIQEMRTRIEEETNREKSGKKVPKK